MQENASPSQVASVSGNPATPTAPTASAGTNVTAPSQVAIAGALSGNPATHIAPAGINVADPTVPGQLAGRVSGNPTAPTASVAGLSLAASAVQPPASGNPAANLLSTPTAPTVPLQVAGPTSGNQAAGFAALTASAAAGTATATSTVAELAALVDSTEAGGTMEEREAKWTIWTRLPGRRAAMGP